MDSRILLLLICTILNHDQVQGRTRFARAETTSEDLQNEKQSLKSRAQPAQRQGQRQLFDLPGPSLDFQSGSVEHSPVLVAAPPGPLLRSISGRRDVDFGDYDTFGSRVHEDFDSDSPVKSIPQAVVAKEPIYIKRLALKTVKGTEKGKGKIAELRETTTEYPENETTTQAVAPEELEEGTATSASAEEFATEVPEVTTAATTDMETELVTFDPDGLEPPPV